MNNKLKIYAEYYIAKQRVDFYEKSKAFLQKDAFKTIQHYIDNAAVVDEFTWKKIFPDELVPLGILLDIECVRDNNAAIYFEENCGFWEEIISPAKFYTYRLESVKPVEIPGLMTFEPIPFSAVDPSSRLSTLERFGLNKELYELLESTQIR